MNKVTRLEEGHKNRLKRLKKELLIEDPEYVALRIAKELDPLKEQDLIALAASRSRNIFVRVAAIEKISPENRDLLIQLSNDTFSPLLVKSAARKRIRSIDGTK